MQDRLTPIRAITATHDCIMMITLICAIVLLIRGAAGFHVYHASRKVGKKAQQQGNLTMDDQSFAHQLSAWLDPVELLEAGLRYESDRDKALAPASLIICSGRLQNGKEGNYETLVQKFISGFRMPQAVIELLHRFEASAELSKETWDWLERLRCSGTIKVYSRTNIQPDVPPNTILTLHERDAVVDILRSPVFALLDLVDRLGIGWRQYAELGASLYHQPNMPTPFYSYLDYQVASAFVKFVSPLHLMDKIGPKFRYRAVTVYGRPTLDDPSYDPIWDMAQTSMRNLASDTHKPI